MGEEGGSGRGWGMEGEMGMEGGGGGETEGVRMERDGAGGGRKGSGV